MILALAAAVKNIKSVVENNAVRKLKYFPIVFDLYSDEMFEAVFLLADFRKIIK